MVPPPTWNRCAAGEDSVGCRDSPAAIYQRHPSHCGNIMSAVIVNNRVRSIELPQSRSFAN